MKETMKTYRFECKRFLQSPLFWITIGVGIAIGLPDFFRQAISMKKIGNPETAIAYYNVFTVYELWIGARAAWTTYQTVFFFVIPLLASMPHALSYLTDQKSGYIKLTVLRAGKKVYMQAKFVAVFLSGGLAITFPLFINFCLTTLYAPLMAPDPYSLYAVIGGTYLAELSYDAPFLHVCVHLLINFVFGGLMATFSLAVAQITDFVLTVWVSPLLLTLLINYIVNVTAAWDWLPTSYLMAGNLSWKTPIPMVIEFTILFVFNFVTAVLVASKRDVI